jgi:hypothetical protein
MIAALVLIPVLAGAAWLTALVLLLAAACLGMGEESAP